VATKGVLRHLHPLGDSPYRGWPIAARECQNFTFDSRKVHISLKFNALPKLKQRFGITTCKDFETNATPNHVTVT